MKYILVKTFWKMKNFPKYIFFSLNYSKQDRVPNKYFF